MKTLTAILFLLICSFVFAQPTIYIVRHAEKVDSWPDAHQAFQPLSSKGISTSDDLAIYFSEINLSAIYSSTTVRTMHTAHSTSLDKEIEITIHDACSDTSEIENFLNYIQNNYTDEEAILIVSHSNIIPYFLIKYGLKESRFDEMDFTKSESGWLLTDYYGEVFIAKPSIPIRREKFCD